MHPSKKPDVAILALEAEIEHYTKLLDKSLTDKEDLEKTKVIFHDLKMLREKLAEMKTAGPYKKVGFQDSSMGRYRQ
jgi:hypothetical protein